MTQYQKLSKQELKELYEDLGAHFGDKADQYKDVIEHVKKFYPPTAHKIRIIFDSEYNDNTYDIEFRGIIVYDSSGHAMLPLQGKEREEMSGRNEFYFDEDESNDSEVDDVIVFVGNQPLLELYKAI